MKSNKYKEICIQNIIIIIDLKYFWNFIIIITFVNYIVSVTHLYNIQYQSLIYITDYVDFYAFIGNCKI